MAPSRKQMLGTNNPFYGKKHSEETLVKIREAAKKRFSKPEDNPMFGVKRSKAFCKRLSKIQKELQVSKKYWAKLKLDPVAYQEAIAKKSLLHKGMKHSEKTKKILREKAAIRNRRPGFKKIVSDNTKAQWKRLKADPVAFAEHSKKISESHKGLMVGKKNPMFGKKWSAETRRKAKEGRDAYWNALRGNPKLWQEYLDKKANQKKLTGKLNPMFGKKPTKAQRQLMSDASKDNWVRIKADPVAMARMKEERSHRWDDPEKNKIMSANMSKAMTGLKRTKKQRKNMSIASIKRMENPVTRAKISQALIGVSAGEKNPMFGKSPVYPIPFKVSGLKHKVRSSYEEKFFLFLKRNHIEYKYESSWFRIEINGVKRNYWPDGHIIGTNIWIEVKGWCTEESVIKMREFRYLCPQNKLFVITEKNNIKNIPAECYDKVFDLKNLEPILDEIKQAKVVPV